MDTQIARFERELLLVEAKEALERGDYERAANRLKALRGLGAGALVGLTAWLSEHAPAAAGLAYRFRRFRKLPRRNA